MKLSSALLPQSLLFLAASLLPAQNVPANWQALFQDRLPLFGHRNWIVITDSAYPAQSNPAIETVNSNAEYFSVLQNVLTALQRSRHVTPIVYLDRELAAVAEDDAPGISGFREQLNTMLNTAQLRSLPTTNLKHEQLIAKLNEVSQTFRVLIIKTNATLPYTSVFLELDCSYWNPSAEHRVRLTMASQR